MIQVGNHVWCPPINGERAYYVKGDWFSQAVVTKVMGNGVIAHLVSYPSLRITRAPVSVLTRVLSPQER